MELRGIGRRRGRLNFSLTRQINESPIKNDSKPLYDQNATASDEVVNFTKRGDCPLGSPLLLGGSISGLGNAPAEVVFNTDLGDRCDVINDVFSGRRKGRNVKISIQI